MTFKRRTKNGERRTGGLWPFVCRPWPTAYSQQSGFTLIEVLVAMTVLAILILMVANIFQGSSLAWNIGTQKSDMNTAARAALDFMARELESAVAGPIDVINPPAPISFQITDNGKNVIFTSLVGDASEARALRHASFYHKEAEYKLMYAHQTNDSPYVPASAPHNGAGMLVANVLDLHFYVYTNEWSLTTGSSWADNDTWYELPICVDIAIKMMSSDDVPRWIATGKSTDFENRNAKLYTTRVYFQNRVGYGRR